MPPGHRGGGGRGRGPGAGRRARGGPVRATALVPFLAAEDGSTIESPCRGQGELFVGGKYVDPPAKDAARAKGICNGCPVKAECLDWALTAGEPYGVWGGMTAHDRRKLRRRQGAPVPERGRLPGAG
ncbi:WhiB family transcriptional regulator [Streptomyces sp. G1]|uniref:WhiB family transcriptional regulator n=1 Tax=Streptomyces sp. G1 TaxID=361572 RepID=UPI0035ABBB6A